jgi:diguanylate cyclase (GGDEF)-like protein/PAS domain S-box-containing protein
MSKETRYRLRLQFSIVSLIAIVASAVTLSIYYRQTTINHMIVVEERNYIGLTQTIANTLIPRYRDFLKLAESLPQAQLVKNPQSQQLHDDVEAMVKDLPILKIKIFDTNGKTLFSTDASQTGSIKPPDYPGSRVARTGGVISSISERDTFLGIDGSEVYNRTVLSSYLPIYGEQDKNIIGVFEIYSDITARLAEIERKQLEVSTTVLVILSLLYLVLLLFVTRADRILTRQHSEHKQATELSARLGRLLDKSSNEIYIFDADSLKFTHVNQGGRDNLGYSAQELSQMTAVDLKPEVSDEEFIALIEPLRNGATEQVIFETVHRRKDGSCYPVDVLLQYSPAEDPPVFVAMILDITEKKKADDTLNYLAYYDNLTGLPNRSLFVDRLEQAVKVADRYEQLVAVLFVDLDKFKNINDSLGHDAGDNLLKNAAERLSSCLRSSDTVARWGGDEFCLLLQNIHHIDHVNVVADKIIERFAEPFNVKDKKMFVTASIGIILYPLDETDVKSLLKNADTAMYHAKEKGRNNYQYYNHEMSARLEQRIELEHELRHALERDEFMLQYQPQVDIQQGRIVGIEALIRWQHPERGMVPPDEFIGIAEETGLILPIGEWVLQQACQQMLALRNTGLPSIHVSINLSVRQLRESTLVDKISQVLQQTGLDPSLLDLEITESMLMSDIDRVKQTLKDLSELGVSISVDDFGTGHSSLAYLKQFPISTLKIDRSFITDIPEDKDDVSITIAIINMAKGLGIKTVAEGVEMKEQLDFLKTHECNLMQGYYFSKPVAFDEIVTLLQQEQANSNPARLGSAI